MTDKLQHLLVISDEMPDVTNPAHSKGATTRTNARIALAMEKRYGLKVSFFGVRENYQALMDMQDQRGTAAILIRSQFEEMHTVQMHLQAQGAPCFFHLADPHVTNKSPDMAERVVLHTNLMKEGSGVIATSDTMYQIAMNGFNDNCCVVSDPVDADNYFAPKTNWINTLSQSGLTVISSGYPFHQPGFHAGAVALKNHSEATGASIDYHVHTALPQKTEAITHKARSGTDYLAEMQAMQAANDNNSGFRLHLHAPFKAAGLYKGAAAADIMLIPGDPEAELTDFQRTWMKHKGHIRPITGLAHGCVVMTVGSVPHSYEQMIANQQILNVPTVDDIMPCLLSLNEENARDMITRGQNYVRTNFDADVLGQTQYGFIQRTLQSRFS